MQNKIPQTFTFHQEPPEIQLVSRLGLAALILLAVLLPCAVSAQESAPQTRLSSRGLAYVNLSTSPATPVSGQPTVILLQFLDPQTKYPRGDIYYKVVIWNETAPVFILPGGSTIAGKVGIPYQFDSPGSYKVEVDLNDTDISKATSASLDRAVFPVYVSKGEPLPANQTLQNATAEEPPQANTESPAKFDSHLVIDIVLAAVAIGLGVYVIRRRSLSRKGLQH